VKEKVMSAIVRLVVVACGVLAAVTPARAQPPGAPNVSVTPPPPTDALQGFGVVLVIGDVQNAATSDNIPPAARAALSDLKDFLPYRSYRVLDTSWVLASSSTRQAVTSRLQGDEQEYEVTLDRVPVGPSLLQVGFKMRETNTDEERRASDRQARAAEALKTEMARQMTRRFLTDKLRNAEAQQNRAEAEELRQRLKELELAMDIDKNQTRSAPGSYAPGGATLIDTSFNISLGETVVVGTSRMRGGNKALIVLVTAVSRSTKPRP
jgi:hypothetical protein